MGTREILAHFFFVLLGTRFACLWIPTRAPAWQEEADKTSPLTSQPETTMSWHQRSEASLAWAVLPGAHPFSWKPKYVNTWIETLWKWWKQKGYRSILRPAEWSSAWQPPIPQGKKNIPQCLFVFHSSFLGSLCCVLALWRSNKMNSGIFWTIFPTPQLLLASWCCWHPLRATR